MMGDRDGVAVVDVVERLVELWNAACEAWPDMRVKPEGVWEVIGRCLPGSPTVDDVVAL